MNKNTKILLIVLVLVIIIGVFSWKYSNKPIPETPTQTLDRETKADTTEQIDANLNSVDVNSSTNADLDEIDQALNNI